jgi:hypothetical protein
VSEPDHDAVTAAEGLTVALRGIREDLAGLRGDLEAARVASEKRDARLAKDARRSRNVVTGLIASFCVDLAVTGLVGWNTIRVNDSQDASHASEISVCRQANVNRREDIAIWNRFLDDIAPPDAKTTPKVRVELAGLNRLIRLKDTPRNCVALYSNGP